MAMANGKGEDGKSRQLLSWLKNFVLPHGTVSVCIGVHEIASAFPRGLKNYKKPVLCSAGAG
jgi:hypothetical protein